MGGEGNPVCIVRKYRSGDEMAIQPIVSETTMETVGDFFWAAVLSEVLPQVSYSERNELSIWYFNYSGQNRL